MADFFRSAHQEQRGVTILELLVVIIVIAVICGFALMQRGAADEQFKRQNVARELKVAFERARFDSVKRRADTAGIQARVVVTASSYTLTTDKDQDGVLGPSDDQVTTISGQNIVISGDVGMTLPVTVTFTQRGEALATDGVGEVIPVFYVCNASCSDPTVANSNILIVTPTGTVNLLPGGAEIPTFSPPTGITNVAPGDSINTYAAMTPTPTPTPP